MTIIKRPSELHRGDTICEGDQPEQVVEVRRKLETRDGVIVYEALCKRRSPIAPHDWDRVRFVSYWSATASILVEPIEGTDQP